MTSRTWGRLVSGLGVMGSFQMNIIIKNVFGFRAKAETDKKKKPMR